MISSLEIRFKSAYQNTPRLFATVNSRLFMSITDEKLFVQEDFL